MTHPLVLIADSSMRISSSRKPE
ncbi:hypothetical protein CCACVL1_01610, partial [Corchorus capsularis]